MTRARRARSRATRARPSATATDEGSAPAQRRRPVRLLRLGNFNQPTYLAAPRGDSRRFVVEREGRIVIVRGRRKLGQPFLDVSERVNPSGEGGLLSMAFARDYERSGRFFVYYTDNEGYLQIDAYRRSDGNPTAPTRARAAR